MYNVGVCRMGTLNSLKMSLFGELPCLFVIWYNQVYMDPLNAFLKLLDCPSTFLNQD